MKGGSMTCANATARLALLLAVVLVGACRTTLRSSAQTPAGFPPPSGPLPSAAPTPDAQAASEVLELAPLLRSAAVENPRLAAARSRWLAARARPAHVGALPDPMVTYTEMFEPIQTRVGPLERSLMLTQRIPFPGKLKARANIASEQARVKELEYHIALRDTFAEVKVSYAELVYLHRAIQIVEQNQKLAAQLATKAAAAYAQNGPAKADGLSLFDSLKAESSLAQLAYDKITLVELLRAEEAKLKALLSRSQSTTLGTPRALLFRPLVASQDDLFLIARARRQEIQAAIHKISAARHAQRLACLSRVPDFSIGVQYSYIGDAVTPTGRNGNDAVGLQLGFTIPLWARKNRAKIEEARHLARAARFEKRRAEDDVMARISKVYFRMANAGRLVTLYDGSLIPQAEQALRVAEQWHDTGRDTFGRLLEARMVWLNFQLASQRALVDYEQMVARLEQLVGISLGHLRTLGTEEAK